MPRLTVEFPEEVNDMLGKLAKDEHTTKREVIRRALALYDYLSEEGVRAGGKHNLAITTKGDNKVIKEIVF